MAPALFDGGLLSTDLLSRGLPSSTPPRGPALHTPTRHCPGPSTSGHTSSGQAKPDPFKPGQIDPAVEPLRQARPQRFRDARPGHLAVVAMAGRPWFIGRICALESGHRAAQAFAQVIDIDTGETERIPAPWIVELLGDGTHGGPRRQL